MRVMVTGGMGFVGSNVVHQALAEGHHVLCTTHRVVPPGPTEYETAAVDLLDADRIEAAVEQWQPDAIVHCAILNDMALARSDPDLADATYVGTTRDLADAAARHDAAMVLVSTDWVFDGTQSGADEATETRPINLYGTLKARSEEAALARGAAVARVSAVNGVHRAQPSSPRDQDAGFGYFVASLVDRLRTGDPFVVWESDDINMAATPSLASETAAMMLRVAEHRSAGVHHCCGGEAFTRMELAQAACTAFDLDVDLVQRGAPDWSQIADRPIPHDTTLTMPRTKAVLDYEPLDVAEQLRRFRHQYEETS